MAARDFTNLNYLRTGSLVQRKGYEALNNSRVFTILHPFRPLLAGTLPLDLFVNSSDLDILCEVYDFESFEKILRENFGSKPAFQYRIKEIGQVASHIYSFRHYHFSFEILGQPIPSFQQTAFCHLIKEYDILERMGPAFHERVLSLKKKGIKTEPAFAQLLGLRGDPYEAILTFEFP